MQIEDPPTCLPFRQASWDGLAHAEFMHTWDDVVELARDLPEVEASTWYRTPALKVAGKGFARLRGEAEGGLVVMCGLDEKAALLDSGDPAFYTTAHYDGYGAILVDLDRVDRRQLLELLTDAWRIKAPARLRPSLGERRGGTH